MSRFVFKFAKAALVAVALSAIPAGISLYPPEAVAQPPRGPSLQALHRARERIDGLRARLRLRFQFFAGVHCAELTSADACKQSPFGCTWNRRAQECHPSSGLENDFLAITTLLSIQNRLIQLGNVIDQATFAFPNPQYLVFVAQACTLSKGIEAEALGGQKLAALPVVGLIQPDEFTDTIDEMDNVQSDLQCP